MNFNIHKNYEYFYLLFKLSSFICFIKVDDASGRLPTYVIYKQINIYWRYYFLLMQMHQPIRLIEASVTPVVTSRSGP